MVDSCGICVEGAVLGSVVCAKTHVVAAQKTPPAESRKKGCCMRTSFKACVPARPFRERNPGCLSGYFRLRWPVSGWP